MMEDIRDDSKDESKKEDGGGMTVREAGRRGGETTARTHSREFYEEIGHKGGKAVSSGEKGRQHMADIGRKGGFLHGESGEEGVKK